jgi:hypothetical protein
LPGVVDTLLQHGTNVGSGVVSYESKLHPVTEQGDLGCSKDALRRVDQDPLRLKQVEDSP